MGAVALGARVFEKHFTDDNNRKGPDHGFAMNPTSWQEMVNRAEELYNALGDGVKRVENNEKESSIVQRRAIRVNQNLKVGTMIKEEHLEMLRPIPIDGVAPYNKSEFLGKKS